MNKLLHNFCFIVIIISANLLSAQKGSLFDKVELNKPQFNKLKFDENLRSANPSKFEAPQQDISSFDYRSSNEPRVLNGDFENSNYWATYNARRYHASSSCGGRKVMKLYGNWSGSGGVARGFIDHLTPGETYTVTWEEYVWDGYSSKYKVYVNGYHYFTDQNESTGWVTRSLTFTADQHCEYIWFINKSYYNLYIDCVDIEVDDNCDDLAFDLPDEEVCNGESVTLTAPDGFDAYSWSTGESTQSITVSPNEDTVYTVTATLDNCEVSNALEVRVNEPFAGIEGDSDICLGEVATLTVVGEDGLTYLWSTGETTQSISVSPSADTEYTCTVNDGTCSSVEAFTVNVADITFELADQTISNGESVTLSAPDGLETYLWSTGETTQSILVSPDDDTIYTVTVTAFGCEFSTSVMITVNNDGSGDRSSSSAFDAHVSINGILMIDTDSKTSQNLTYSVYALNGLNANNKFRTTTINQGKNNLRINLKENYNLKSFNYYVLEIKGNSLDKPYRIKFVVR